MSGNPFRRSQASKLAEERTASPQRGLQLDTDAGRGGSVTPPPKQKVKKRVQIRSPPASPTSPEVYHRPRFGQGIDAEGDGPPAPVEREGAALSSGSEVGQEALDNMRRNSGALDQNNAAAAAPRPGGAPLNPFARTMASNEAKFGLGDQGQQDGGAQPWPQGGKGRMDVDAFKNMLMTGSTTPSPPVGTVSGSGQGNAQDSSSTDTSSGSRHSGFDPAIDSLRSPDSPRTSFDHSDDEEEHNDDEHANLMRRQDDPKATLPRHKHGKALGLRGPQTVSFADFDETIPLPRTPTSENQSSVTRPPLGRSPSDLNKPLPPPPRGQSSPEVAKPAVPEKDDPSAQGKSESSDEEIAEEASPVTAVDHQEAAPAIEAKRAPPPPPASRRQGGGHNRTRSTSNLSTGSGNDEIVDELPSKPTSTPRKAPLPPPSRRAHGLASPAPSPAVETPPSEPQTLPQSPLPEPSSLFPSEAPSSSQRPTDASKAMPPPPAPRRNPSKTGSITRSGSSASRTSIPRSETSASGAQAPPPPPSRRSKPAANLSNRRTSSQSEIAEATAERSSSLGSVSLSSNDKAVGGEEGKVEGQKDILADIAALQKEVDELRAKAGKS